MQEHDVETAVKKVLQDQFPSAKVVKVVACSDVDSDGDKVFRVEVVLEGDPAELDREALVSFVRHLRVRLEQLDRDEFPILSFVSAKEAKKLSFEAA